MNVENYIEFQHRELIQDGIVNAEFADFYSSVQHVKLRELLTTLHYDFISLFRTMNERLPTNEYEAHFWADPSRQLMKTIEIALGLYNTLKNSKYAFQIDTYYSDLITQCRGFLNSSGGSRIPAHMEKVELYYTVPIFIPSSVVSIKMPQADAAYSLIQIGSGSYANVFKYKDTFYNKHFVIKRAKKDLSDKEIERFKREFEEMQDFSSPYIPEVYCYNKDQNEYIMEYMDYTLEKYIDKHNSTLDINQRKGIVNQILKAFGYIHSKGRLHRDISPKNILVKEYEDILVVKVADFGLVKVPDSLLTTVNTEFKGCFNDPGLVVDGFDTYGILHETFALTRIIYYVMTGKTNVDKISDPKWKVFVNKGLNVNKGLRYRSIAEIAQAFKVIG